MRKSKVKMQKIRTYGWAVVDKETNAVEYLSSYCIFETKHEAGENLSGYAEWQKLKVVKVKITEVK